MERTTDPRIIGPGQWDFLHALGAWADRTGSVETFTKLVNAHQASFACAECKEHYGQFLSQYPPETFRYYVDEQGTPRGMFRWTWFFHNNVNRRLGKASLSWNQACQMYDEPEIPICNQGCAQPTQPKTGLIPSQPPVQPNPVQFSAAFPQYLKPGSTSQPANSKRRFMIASRMSYDL